MIYYNFFSRTEIFTILLISIFCILNNYMKCLRILSKLFSILFLFYALFFYLIYSGLLKNYFLILDFLNNISSYVCTEDNIIEGFSRGINDIG